MTLPHRTDPHLSTSAAAQDASDEMTPDVSDGLAPESFEVLYREAWPAVVDYLRFRIGPTDAPDVASDIFARAWAARRQYDPVRGAPESWLWGITRNAARDWHRDHAVPVRPLAESVAMEANLPERGARAETMAHVAAAVSHLEPIDQDIIALRFGGGLSHRDVGDTVGLSEAAAAMRLHRAIKRLRVALEGRGSK